MNEENENEKNENEESEYKSLSMYENISKVLNHDMLKNEKFKITSSSGSSNILIFENLDIVVQVYNFKKSIEIILTLMKILNHKESIEINFKFFSGTCFRDRIIDFNVSKSFNVMDYVCNFVSYDEGSDSIVWRKLIPLKSIQAYESFVRNNWKKFLWDTSIILFILNKLKLTHSDFTLDNLGIYNGNFVIYDLDSIKFEYIDGLDVNSFINSLRFNNLIKDWKFLFPRQLVSKFSKMEKRTYLETLDMFRELKLQK